MQRLHVGASAPREGQTHREAGAQSLGACQRAGSRVAERRGDAYETPGIPFLPGEKGE